MSLEIKEITTFQELHDLHSAGKLQGLYYMSDDIYFHKNCPGVSQSMLKSYRKAPAKMKDTMDYGIKQSQAILNGKLYDSMLTTKNFEDQFAILPTEAFVNERGQRTTKNSKIWKSFKEENPGKECFVRFEIEGVLDAVQKMRMSKLYDKYINERQCYFQVVVFTYIAGVLCKGKLDVLSKIPDREAYDIIDFKLTERLGLKGFSYGARDFGYDIQNAFYVYAFENYIEINDFIFAVSESLRPYLPAWYRIDSESIERATDFIQAEMPNVQYSIDTNDFPGYPDEIQEVKLWK